MALNVPNKALEFNPLVHLIINTIKLTENTHWTKFFAKIQWKTFANIQAAVKIRCHALNRSDNPYCQVSYLTTMRGNSFFLFGLILEPLTTKYGQWWIFSNYLALVISVLLIL